MKKFTYLKKCTIALCFSWATLFQLMGNETLIINENMQSWKTFSSYKDAEQEITVNGKTGIAALNQVMVRTGLPSPIDTQGTCSEGYIQLSNEKKSSIVLPTIQGGVTKIELHIITTAAASRSIDVKVAETGATKTFADLSKTGTAFSATIGTTGNTTLSIENVTGGTVYITDIKVYQNASAKEVSSDATLSSLSYRTGGETVAVPNFQPSVLQYQVALPEGSSIPTVIAVTNHKDAAVAYTQAETLPGKAIVKVTASDDISAKEYAINFTIPVSQDNLATLPLSAAGDSENPLHGLTGFTAQNLGSAMSDGGAKFEGSKALTDNKPALILAFNAVADKLSFEAKGNNAGSPSGFEGVEFIVEESGDGIDYSLIADISSSLTTSKQTFNGYQVKSESRFIRWTYKNAVKGNIALNNVVLTKGISNISEADQGKMSAYAAAGKIYVNTTAGEIIEVFNLLGQRLLSIKAQEGLNELQVGSGQIVLIKVGTKTWKLAL